MNYESYLEVMRVTLGLFPGATEADMEARAIERMEAAGWDVSLYEHGGFRQVTLRTEGCELTRHQYATISMKNPVLDLYEDFLRIREMQEDDMTVLVDRNPSQCRVRFRGTGCKTITTTSTGDFMYIRYRWGCLRIDLWGDSNGDRDTETVTIFSDDTGDEFDGFMTYDELKQRVPDWIVLPEVEG